MRYNESFAHTLRTLAQTAIKAEKVIMTLNETLRINKEYFKDMTLTERLKTKHTSRK